jgi:hypothetical protein
LTTGKLDTNISEIFGKGLSFNIISNSILFALIFFFYILTVGSFFKPLIFPLIDRVTYSTQFVDKYIINNYYDAVIISFCTTFWFLASIKGNFKFVLSFFYGVSTVIALLGGIQILLSFLSLLSIPLIITFICFNKFMVDKIIFFNKQICINYFSILGIIIGIISFSTIIVHLFIPQHALPPINYLYYIFLLSSIFTPLLLILISIFFFSSWLISKIMGIRKVSTNKNTFINKTLSLPPQYLKLRTRIIYLLLFVLFSIAITIIPHMYTINKDSQIIGDDTLAYVSMLNSINNSQNIQEFLKQSFIIQFSGDRPFSLVLFYLWVHMIDPNNIVTSIEYLPLILGPFLILSIYFLTLELTANHVTALLASFLTITSFHILVGTYAGLYSNWLSLIFGYLAILFLFRIFKKHTKSNIILFSILMVVTLLCHAPTWTILTLVIAILFGIVLITKQIDKNIILYLFLAILPSIVIDGTRMILIKSSGLVEDISFAHSQGAGLHDFSMFWNNLVSTTQVYMAGQFGNSIIFILVLYWLYKCNRNIKDKSTLLMVIFFSLTILPILFGEKQIQTRFLFEIPFQIPAAIALTYIRKNQGNVFFFAICLWLVVVSIRAISNFYYIQQ